MNYPYPSWSSPHKVILSRTLFFGFSSIAFIALSTPALAVYMRGLLGFLVILAIAILAGLVESSFNRVLRFISMGISQNKFLFVCVIWYVLGFVLNTFMRGGGLIDWRLMMTPILILLGLFFAFAFMHDDLCLRYFQISFISVAGIQSFASMRVLSNTTGIARMMWYETSGAWVYGNQLYFAMYAVVLPVLLWRSFRESGLLRLFLIIFCLFMLITSSISAFATPLALIILSALIILALSVFLFGRRNWKLVLLLVIFIPIILLYSYRLTYDNPMFSQAYYRINNVIRDPTSGGYSTRGAVSRWDLANISFRTFKEEPLFGMGGPREYNPFVGRHSSFFDSLAIYGLFGGGGAICGIILIILSNAIWQFWHIRNWETLFVLIVVILLTVVGVVNPYWEGMIPIVFIIARPFNRNEYYVEKARNPIMVNSTRRSL